MCRARRQGTRETDAIQNGRYEYSFDTALAEEDKIQALVKPREGAVRRGAKLRNPSGCAQEKQGRNVRDAKRHTMQGECAGKDAEAQRNGRRAGGGHKGAGCGEGIAEEETNNEGEERRDEGGETEGRGEARASKKGEGSRNENGKRRKRMREGAKALRVRSATLTPLHRTDRCSRDANISTHATHAPPHTPPVHEGRGKQCD
eukprot:5041179-Pleurochrysis_carterae.AAC.1